MILVAVGLDVRVPVCPGVLRLFSLDPAPSQHLAGYLVEADE